MFQLTSIMNQKRNGDSDNRPRSELVHSLILLCLVGQSNILEPLISENV